MWCLWCQAWSVRPNGPKGPAAIRAIRTMDTRHPWQGVGHCWIDRIDGLLHKSLGQLITSVYTILVHIDLIRFGDTKQRNLLLQRPCSSLFRRSLSHAPHLSLLCGVSGIQSSSRNAHFCKAGAFLFLAACAMFAQFCHSKVHKGVGNLENLKCNWMCSMTSWMFQQVKYETSEGAMCHLLSRNKWTRNSSVTIVTTHKSSSMTPS